jgi:hypothetical protein
MSTPTDYEFLDIRVALFGNVELPLKKLACFDSTDIKAIIKHIRQYADLPYVYVVPGPQKNLVIELLAELRKIQSPCYPYAIFAEQPEDFDSAQLSLDVIPAQGLDPAQLLEKIVDYANCKFLFDESKLKFSGAVNPPQRVDVAIVGAGLVGLYAANKLKEQGLSVCVIEKRDKIGGIWSMYANATSQVNTSEGAYRIIENKIRPNRDHSTTREILEDISQIANQVSHDLIMNTRVDQIAKHGSFYRVRMTTANQEQTLESKGIILAINDRVGEPRVLSWKHQDRFQGTILAGIADEAKGFDWKGKKIIVVGMGAFAIENARTALIGGASQVTVICRRHGTVCPKIIDYLNFATPYDEDFRHDKKSNIRNMMLWKKLYNLSGATEPECWMGKIKHKGHTISVSDLWFIGHYMKKITTVVGNITAMDATGVIVNGQQHIDADVVVNCIGFHRNAPVAKDICDYRQMYNINYVDQDFMYLADAYLDDDVFNSFFGSSVLEMTKYYLEVFLYFFNNPEYHAMINSNGIERIAIEDRSWSHYIAGASALIQNYPFFHKVAKSQVRQRTQSFLQVHDLETYISENKREWIDIHSQLAGSPMAESDCLPYVFEKLLDKKS